MVKQPSDWPRKAKYSRQDVVDLLRERGCHIDPRQTPKLESAEWWLTKNGKRFTLPYSVPGGFADVIVQNILLQVKNLTSLG